MFEPGKLYDRRRDIHAKYAGQQQGGIATPRDKPYIFLFTGESGEQYGYKDGWDADGVFLYTGEGQLGDMEFVRGNRAIRDHAKEGKDLLLFESVDKGMYRHLGRFACTTWQYGERPDVNGAPRRTIVFHLIKQGEDTPLEVGAGDTGVLTLADLRQRAYDAATPASEGRERDARVTYYARSRDVHRYTLARANGACESCRRPAPFERRNGSGYLEPHHTRRLSDSGPDHPRWVGAICPNCHREIHYGANGIEKNQRLEDYLGTVEEDS